MPGQILMLASCAIVFGLGVAHLALTFFSNRFEPRDSRLLGQLKTVSPIISRDTTMWRAATGFHISHSGFYMLPANALLGALAGWVGWGRYQVPLPGR